MSEQPSPAAEEEQRPQEQAQPTQEEREQELKMAALNRVVYAQAAHHLFELLKEIGESPVELLEVSCQSQNETGLQKNSFDLEQIIAWLREKQLTDLQPELIKLTRESLLKDSDLQDQAAAIEKILKSYSEYD